MKKYKNTKHGNTLSVVRWEEGDVVVITTPTRCLYAGHVGTISDTKMCRIMEAASPLNEEPIYIWEHNTQEVYPLELIGLAYNHQLLTQTYMGGLKLLKKLTVPLPLEIKHLQKEMFK